jgi:hypothetical protein
MQVLLQGTGYIQILFHMYTDTNVGICRSPFFKLASPAIRRYSIWLNKTWSIHHSRRPNSFQYPLYHRILMRDALWENKLSSSTPSQQSQASQDISEINARQPYLFSHYFGREFPLVHLSVLSGCLGELVSATSSKRHCQTQLMVGPSMYLWPSTSLFVPCLHG